MNLPSLAIRWNDWKKMRVIDVVANEYIDFASKKAAARAPVERDNTKKVK